VCSVTLCKNLFVSAIRFVHIVRKETKERDVAQNITQEHSESADLCKGESSQELESGSTQFKHLHVMGTFLSKDTFMIKFS